jgi:Uma2 family endonuclease
MNKSNLAFVRESFTVEEYLEFDCQSEERHEFEDGEVIAMAGATRAHSIICGNVFGNLWNRLRNKDCEVHQTDLRTQVKTSRYYYPDVVVVCGERKFDEKSDILLNPTIVFEVLSKSTKVRDKGIKLESYLNKDSIKECILIEQDQIRVEHYLRNQEGKWEQKIFEDLNQSLKLSSVDCEISPAEIYEDIKFSTNLKSVKS